MELNLNSYTDAEDAFKTENATSNAVGSTSVTAAGKIANRRLQPVHKELIESAAVHPLPSTTEAAGLEQQVLTTFTLNLKTICSSYH